MPIQEGVNDLYYEWALGESGWNAQMDSNILKIGAFLSINVIDRDLTVPSGSPANGDCYIPATAATGLWAGEDGNIAVWRDDLSQWEFYVPPIGLLAFVNDEDKLIVMKDAGWSVGIAI